MSYILILLVYANAWSKYESSTLTSIPGFATKASCDIAGKAASDKLASGTKAISFVCVEQGK